MPTRLRSRRTMIHGYLPRMEDLHRWLGMIMCCASGLWGQTYMGVPYTVVDGLASIRPSDGLLELLAPGGINQPPITAAPWIYPYSRALIAGQFGSSGTYTARGFVAVLVQPTSTSGTISYLGGSGGGVPGLSNRVAVGGNSGSVPSGAVYSGGTWQGVLASFVDTPPGAGGAAGTTTSGFGYAGAYGTFVLPQAPLGYIGAQTLDNRQAPGLSLATQVNRSPGTNMLMFTGPKSSTDQTLGQLAVMSANSTGDFTNSLGGNFSPLSYTVGLDFWGNGSGTNTGIASMSPQPPTSDQYLTVKALAYADFVSLLNSNTPIITRSGFPAILWYGAGTQTQSWGPGTVDVKNNQQLILTGTLTAQATTAPSGKFWKVTAIEDVIFGQTVKSTLDWSAIDATRTLQTDQAYVAGGLTVKGPAVAGRAFNWTIDSMQVFPSRTLSTQDNVNITIGSLTNSGTMDFSSAGSSLTINGGTNNAGATIIGSNVTVGAGFTNNGTLQLNDLTIPTGTTTSVGGAGSGSYVVGTLNMAGGTLNRAGSSGLTINTAFQQTAGSSAFINASGANSYTTPALSVTGGTLSFTNSAAATTLTVPSITYTSGSGTGGVTRAAGGFAVTGAITSTTGTNTFTNAASAGDMPLSSVVVSSPSSLTLANQDATQWIRTRDVTVASGSTLNLQGQVKLGDTIGSAGSSTVNGTLALSSGTVQNLGTMTGSLSLLSSSGTSSYQQSSAAGANQFSKLNVSGALTVSAQGSGSLTFQDVDLTAGSLTRASSSVSFGNTLTAVSGSNTLINQAGELPLKSVQIAAGSLTLNNQVEGQSIRLGNLSVPAGTTLATTGAVSLGDTTVQAGASSALSGTLSLQSSTLTNLGPVTGALTGLTTTGTNTLNQSAGLGALNLPAATVAGTLELNAGASSSISMSGATLSAGTLKLASGAVSFTGNLTAASGSNTFNLAAGSASLTGITVQGTSSLTLQNQLATLEVPNITMAGAGTVTLAGPGPINLNNSSNIAGSLALDSPVTSTGTFSVGTLSLNTTLSGSGQITAANFNSSGGSIAAGKVTSTTSSVSSGTLTVAGKALLGALTLSDASTVATATGTLTASSLTLAGTTGGQMNWSAITQDQTLTLSSMTASADYSLVGPAVSSGKKVSYTTTSLTIDSGADLTIQGAVQISAPSLVNQGTLDLSGAGGALAAGTVSNPGTLKANAFTSQSGILTNTGTLELTTLTVPTGVTQTFSTTGAGSTQVGALNMAGGTLQRSGAVAWSPGTLSQSSGSSSLVNSNGAGAWSLPSATITAGTLSLTNQDAAALSIAGASLQGGNLQRASGLLTVTGPLTSGSGTNQIVNQAGALLLPTVQGLNTSNLTLENQDAVEWVSTGDLSIAASAGLTLKGRIKLGDVAADPSPTTTIGSDLKLQNATVQNLTAMTLSGALVSDTGTNSLSNAVGDLGLSSVVVQPGSSLTLSNLATGKATQIGSLDVKATGNLTLSGGVTLGDPALSPSPGSTINGGLTLSGAVLSNLSPVTGTVSAINVSGASSWTQTATAGNLTVTALDIASGSLDVTSQSGADVELGTVELTSGVLTRKAGGGSFSISGTLKGASGSNGFINEGGALTIASAEVVGTSTFSMTNQDIANTLKVQALSMPGNGTLNLNGPGSIELEGSNTLQGGLNVAGPLINSGITTAGTVSLLGATLSGTGTLQGAAVTLGSGRLEGGQLTSTGTSTLSNQTFTIASGSADLADFTMSSGTVVVSGAGSFDASTLSLQGTGAIDWTGVTQNQSVAFDGTQVPGVYLLKGPVAPQQVDMVSASMTIPSGGSLTGSGNLNLTATNLDLTGTLDFSAPGTSLTIGTGVNNGTLKADRLAFIGSGQFVNNGTMPVTELMIAPGADITLEQGSGTMTVGTLDMAGGTLNRGPTSSFPFSNLTQTGGTSTLKNLAGAGAWNLPQAQISGGTLQIDNADSAAVTLAGAVMTGGGLRRQSGNLLISAPIVAQSGLNSLTNGAAAGPWTVPNVQVTGSAQLNVSNLDTNDPIVLQTVQVAADAGLGLNGRIRLGSGGSTTLDGDLELSDATVLNQGPLNAGPNAGIVAQAGVNVLENQSGIGTVPRLSVQPGASLDFNNQAGTPVTITSLAMNGAGPLKLSGSGSFKIGGSTTSSGTLQIAADTENLGTVAVTRLELLNATLSGAAGQIQTSQFASPGGTLAAGRVDVSSTSEVTGQLQVSSAVANLKALTLSNGALALGPGASVTTDSLTVDGSGTLWQQAGAVIPSSAFPLVNVGLGSLTLKNDNATSAFGVNQLNLTVGQAQQGQLLLQGAGATSVTQLNLNAGSPAPTAGLFVIAPAAGVGSFSAQTVNLAPMTLELKPTATSPINLGKVNMLQSTAAIPTKLVRSEAGALTVTEVDFTDGALVQNQASGTLQIGTVTKNAPIAGNPPAALENSLGRMQVTSAVFKANTLDSVIRQNSTDPLSITNLTIETGSNVTTTGTGTGTFDIASITATGQLNNNWPFGLAIQNELNLSGGSVQQNQGVLNASAATTRVSANSSLQVTGGASAALGPVTLTGATFTLSNQSAAPQGLSVNGAVSRSGSGAVSVINAAGASTAFGSSCDVTTATLTGGTTTFGGPLQATTVNLVSGSVSMKDATVDNVIDTNATLTLQGPGFTQTIRSMSLNQGSLVVESGANPNFTAITQTGGEVQIASGATVTVAGLYQMANGTLKGPGLVSIDDLQVIGSVNIQGELFVSHWVGATDVEAVVVDASGTLDVASDLNMGTAVLQSRGLVNIEDDFTGSVQQLAGTFTIGGEYQVLPQGFAEIGAEFNVGGPITVFSGGRFDLEPGADVRIDVSSQSLTPDVLLQPGSRGAFAAGSNLNVRGRLEAAGLYAQQGTVTVRQQVDLLGSYSIAGALLESETMPIIVQPGAVLSVTGPGSVLSTPHPLGVVVKGTLAARHPLRINPSTNLTLDPAGLVSLAIAKGSPSTIAVAGTASLDGALALEIARGRWRRGDVVPLITAQGGLTGDFSSLAYNPPRFGRITTLQYTADAVNLLFLRGTEVVIAPKTGSQACLVNLLNQFQVDVGEGVLADFLEDVLNEFPASTPSCVLQQLLPEAYADLSPLALLTGELTTQSIGKQQWRVHDLWLQNRPGWHGWVDGFAQMAYRDGEEVCEWSPWSAGSASFDFGADYRIGQDFLVGAAANLQRSHQWVDLLASTAHMNAYGASLYASAFQGNAIAERGRGFYADLQGGVSALHGDLERFVCIPGFEECLGSDFNGLRAQGRLELGGILQGKHGGIQPYLAGALLWARINGFCENSKSPIGLESLDSFSSHAYLVEPGLRLFGLFPQKGWSFQPEFTAAYSYNFVEDPDCVSFTLQQFPVCPGCCLPGLEPPRGVVRLGAGAVAQFGSRVQLAVRGNGQFSPGWVSGGANVQLSVGF